MRAYQVSYKKDEAVKKQYCETQKDAKSKRREIMETESLKLAEITIEQVEIPTKKGELLNWINTVV